MTPRLQAKSAMLGGAMLLCLPASARADTTGAIQAVAGAAVMGAELSVVGEALAGLQGNWFYVAGSVAGAAGGGVAAYYWVDFDGQYGPQFLVAGAFALFVPAMIGIASSQYYRPETDLRRGPPSELGLSLQLPQVYVGDSYTRDQRQLFGLQRSSDFTFYLLNGVF